VVLAVESLGYAGAQLFWGERWRVQGSEQALHDFSGEDRRGDLA
jgi:hypothetical protein